MMDYDSSKHRRNIGNNLFITKSQDTRLAHEFTGSNNIRIYTRHIRVSACVEFGAFDGIPSYLWNNSRG